MASVDTMNAPLPADDPGFFIVLNGGSGKQGVDATTSAIREGLAQAGRLYELAEAGPGELDAKAAEMARKARAAGGVLVAAGGDGTLRSVAQLALEQQLPFGVLPAGTFNYFGRSYGIPVEMADAVQSLATAVERPVQVGLVNGRVFLVNASVGLYPDLLEDREAFKQRFGRTRLVAMFSALATLFRDHRPLLLEFTHDGERRVVGTASLFVGNSRLQLEQVGIEEAAVVRHGQLAAVVVKVLNRWGLAQVALRGALGSLGEAEGVESFSFVDLDVRQRAGSKRTIKVATDGEIAQLALPLRFSVAPQPLRLLLPRRPATPVP